MRIGVNALYLIPGGVGGTEIYLRNLLRSMAEIDPQNTWLVFTNTETDGGLVPKAPNFLHMPQRVRATNRPFRLIWEQTALPLECMSNNIDVLFNPGFTAPAMSTRPNVTVFHDLQHKRHPEHFRRFDLPAWNIALSLAVQRSRLLIADSEATKADLMHFYKLPAERIRVALLGVEEAFLSIGEQRGPVEPYILCVSTLHPHKNIERLVRVFARFRQERPEWRLVLAGMRGFRTEEIEKTIRTHALQDAVRVTGWIPRHELYELYRRAAAFVYPSTFEGFGLPVLEAMASGIPLACSDIEPLRSTAGGTARLFDPYNDEAMIEAMRSIVDSGTSTQAARQRAATFTWRRCAQQTLDAIFSAADPRA